MDKNDIIEENKAVHLGHGKTNPWIGMTNSRFKILISSNLRKTHGMSVRSQFVNSVQRPYAGSGRFKLGVDCVDCNKHFGKSEKVTVIGKNGRKRTTAAYQVDHVYGIHPLKDLTEDLSQHVADMMYGELQVLCYHCHQDKSIKEVKEKKVNREANKAKEMLKQFNKNNELGLDF